MILSLLALLAAFQPASTPQPCTERETVRTTVTEIGRDPARFLDHCVTVTGTFAGIRMYSGREGMYLAWRFGRDGNWTADRRLHRIGIDNQAMRNSRLTSPQVATVTGRVDSCERRSQRIRDAGGIPFLGGYCHYESGPTIVVTSYTITGTGHERLMGERARRRLGNLVAMPVDWPHRARIESVAAAFLAALRAGDRAQLATLHLFNDPGNRHSQAVLRSLLDDPGSPFAALRRAAPAQAAYFVSAAADGTPLGREQPMSGGTICFCRTTDCSGRWPISSSDADNDLDAPYVCTLVQAGQRGDQGIVHTPFGGGWLREPPRTAFRATVSRSTR